MWIPTAGRCDLASLVRVEFEGRCGNRVTTDVRCFISNLPSEARSLPRAVRRHWSIAHAPHWVMDIAFGEDDNRIRTGHAAHNRAILKCTAHNLTWQDRSAPRTGPRHR